MFMINEYYGDLYNINYNLELQEGTLYGASYT